MIWFVAFVPCCLFAAFRAGLPNQMWDFDWGSAEATFTLMLNRYEKIARGMAALAVALLIAAVFSHEKMGVGTKAAFAGAALYSSLFSGWLGWAYESYLHARYPRVGARGPSNYSTTKLSVTYALAASAVMLLAVGLFSFARAL